jgi:hypothetical protein
MKEILESNVITKYLAGFSTPKEEKELEVWLQNNPNNAMVIAFMQGQVNKMVSEIRTA